MTTQEIRDHLCTAGNIELRYFPFQVAKDTSDLAAILLYDLQGRISRQKKKNIRGHRQWTFDPMRLFVEAHPYATESGVRKAFLALAKAGLITIEKSGKFNKAKFDKKWWYSVTTDGMRKAKVRLVRFRPEVADALDIPKAVLLEHFRFRLHADGGEYVTIDPATLGVPYHKKTIQRHLDALVKQGILQRHATDKNQYRLAEPVADWKNQKAPITVPPSKLLPVLKPGDVGLLAGHTGTGKTSVSSFTAVQMALAGSKVLYITLEEPAGNIANRGYAGEYGIAYSALHRGDEVALTELAAEYSTQSDRKLQIGKNLKFIDLSGQHSQTHELADAIHQVQGGGFIPDVVIIDQLEFISVEHEESTGAPDLPDDEDEKRVVASGVGMAIPPAILIRACLGDRKFVTWVLHQVLGDNEWEFESRSIAGGEVVVNHFDCVVGIGRSANDSPALHLFSLTPAIPFEQVLDADFAHMRFRPKD